MEISATTIKELRGRTSAGIMDCKRALEEAGGDLDKAADILAKQGIASAVKKAARSTEEGIVESYIHSGGRIGVLVEVNCETDFVARTPDFKELAHDLAMQIAAMSPEYVDSADVPQGEDADGQETVLMKQPFIKDPTKSIADLVNEGIGRLGEKHPRAPLYQVLPGRVKQPLQSADAKYDRVLLKLSGESFPGDSGYGADSTAVAYMARQIRTICELGVQIGVVVGGGNILRGWQAEAQGMDRATADYAGMLATIINALALQDALERYHNLEVRTQSAISVQQIAEPYIRRRRHTPLGARPRGHIRGRHRQPVYDHRHRRCAALGGNRGEGAAYGEEQRGRHL